MTVLWWILGGIGALVLLLLLWAAYRVLRIRRLQPTVFEYLDSRSVRKALSILEDHPELLTPEAESIISVQLDRAWVRGEAHLFVSGVLRLSLLVACREYGLEAASRMAGGRLQAWLDAVDSPSGQRALDLLGRLVVEEEAVISPEEVDAELVDALERILELLRPLAATEETAAQMEEMMRTLHQIWREKGEA